MNEDQLEHSFNTADLSRYNYIWSLNRLLCGEKVNRNKDLHQSLTNSFASKDKTSEWQFGLGISNLSENGH